MSRRYFLSRKGLAALHFQQNSLIDDLSESTRAMGRSASLDNDLRENPEFMQLRTRVTYEIPAKLAETFSELLSDAEKRQTLAKNAFAVMKKNRGATEKTIEYIKTFLLSDGK